MYDERETVTGGPTYPDTPTLNDGGTGAHPMSLSPTYHVTHAGAQMVPGIQNQP
jgi:hypothetical protein